MVRSTSLSLGIPSNPSPISSNVTSPTDPGSHPSTPGSTAGGRAQDEIVPQSRLNHTELQIPFSRVAEEAPLSPEFTSLPPFPESPSQFSRSGQEPSKGFFANLKASKSSNKVNNVSEPTIRQVPEDASRRDADVLDNSEYSRQNLGSNPDLRLHTPEPEPTVTLDHNMNLLSVDEPKRAGYNELEQTIPRRPVGSPTRSSDPSGKGRTEALQMKKPKPRFGNLINRTSGLSGLSAPQKVKPVNPIITSTRLQPQLQMDGANDSLSRSNTPVTPSTPLSAPLPRERPTYDERSLIPEANPAPSPRNRSAERSQTGTGHGQDFRYLHSGLTSSSSGTFREGPPSSSHLFSNIKNTSSRAAGGLNKAGKGIFAKMGRSGSNTVVAQEDPRYVCHIINLPLVEQTRKTRIAARLENSKDKTEFWMPALPWRCIDYLNFRGCEEEGLYRVPGSDREIRLWQRRFDQEGDINLFDEDNLYDINIIGSLFKSWLRELPTEIFPKATQTKIYQENANAVEVPQMLKDELSSLPPWNYYLLFAITCHLSLLTAYSDKNKMTYGNLVICFQPCLKIDNFCFQFLVQQWRECWQGCWTEKDALEEEYRVIDGRETELPGSSGNSSGGSTAVGGEERSIGSSASNKPMNTTRSQQKQSHQPYSQHLGQPQAPPQQHQSRGPQLKLSTENGDHLSVPSGNEPQTNTHARAGSQLPELAPVQPLSPIGF